MFSFCLLPDVDECVEQHNGGCQQDCYDTGGSYNCDCYQGFYLMADDHSCGG